ncbi:hypothetical protein [Gemmatimonas sp.]|uniref:hypothetical protein n=1 Tax=Gemmatimonas sp. TaxID=1962908 RepID=UPI0037BF7FEC
MHTPPLIEGHTMNDVRAQSLIGRVMAAASLIVLGACGGGGDVAAPPPEVQRLTIASVVVEEPATGTVYFSHDDHWHGFPTVRTGNSSRYLVHFVKQGRSPDDHDMPPRNEWFTLATRGDHSLPVVIEDPSRARWLGDRLGGTLFGDASGASRMSLRVFRGSTTVWEAPPLNFIVR